jgi:uncharacterized membrane protein YeaQ/YmgE (transglycosylase-associated protein family)
MEVRVMSILGWILFGFVVGLIARAIMPGRDPMGMIGTTMLGIFGALLAGWMGQAFGWYGPDDGAGFISATVGAIAVLAVYYAIAGRKKIINKSSTLDHRNVA